MVSLNDDLSRFFSAQLTCVSSVYLNEVRSFVMITMLTQREAARIAAAKIQYWQYACSFPASSWKSVNAFVVPFR
jgi:hypothetical protein